MKKISILCLAILLLGACQKYSETSSKGFSVDNDEVLVGPEEVTENITLFADGNNWVASSEENWILISPANGNADTKCNLVIKTTQKDEDRKGTIRFTNLSTNEKVLVNVTQRGFAKRINLDTKSVHLPNYEGIDKRFFEVEVDANVNFKVEVEAVQVGSEVVSTSWITPEDLDMELTTGYIPNKKTLRINWKINTNPTASRKVKLKFLPTNGDVLTSSEPVEIEVTQDAGDVIEDSRQGDSTAILAIARNIDLEVSWASNENMDTWDNVTLWKRNDKDLPCEAAIGRVRSIRFFLFDTAESIHYEVRYLKYAEFIDFSSNLNSDIREYVGMSENFKDLKYLKGIRFFAVGISEIDESLKNLIQLENIDITANNFTTWPEILKKENFPNVKHFRFSGNSMDVAYDLSQVAKDFKPGLEIDLKSISHLFTWDKLETLAIGNQYVYGSIPTEEELIAEFGEEAFGRYTAAELTDTTMYALGKLKVLPNVKEFRLNLNRITGDLPDWLLYHPNLLFWDPFTLVFNQDGRTREGKVSGFNNTPINFDYYYEAYPLLKMPEEEYFEEDEDPLR